MPVHPLRRRRRRPWLGKRAKSREPNSPRTAPKAPLLARIIIIPVNMLYIPTPTQLYNCLCLCPPSHYCGAVGAALGSESEPIQGTQLPGNSPRTAPKAPLLARIILIPVINISPSHYGAWLGKRAKLYDNQAV